MGKNLLVGVGGKARKVKALYVGVGGKARKVKKVYVGVGGKARLVYQSYIPVTGITLTVQPRVPNGRSCTLTAIFSPANATNKTVKWTSSNQSVVNGLNIVSFTSNSCVITPYGSYTETNSNITATSADGTSASLSMMSSGLVGGSDNNNLRWAWR